MLEGRILVSAIMLVAFAAAVGLAFTYAPEARFCLVIGIRGCCFRSSVRKGCATGPSRR
jgi:hypothetical protein